VVLLTVALLARDLGDDVVVFRFCLFQAWMGLFGCRQRLLVLFQQCFSCSVGVLVLGVMVYCSGGCCFTADLVVVNGVSGCPPADLAMVWWW
jgi:hypothetical protein